MLTNLQVKNENDDVINFDLRSPNSEDGVYPLVVFFHGFKGFKDWGFIPYFCQRLAESNIVVNVDFSLNGIVDATEYIYDVEKFRRNTISQQIRDANLVLNYIKPILEGTKYFNGQIYLVGHSLGGAIAIFLSTLRNDINKIALLASISKLDRNTARQKLAWKECGTIKVTVPQSDQELLLNYSYQEDKDTNFTTDQILNDLGRFPGEVLIINGKQDFTVRYNEAETLAEIRKKQGLEDRTVLHLIEKCGHTFNIFSKKDTEGKKLNLENNPCLNGVVSITADFFRG